MRHKKNKTNERKGKTMNIFQTIIEVATKSVKVWANKSLPDMIINYKEASINWDVAPDVLAIVDIPTDRDTISVAVIDEGDVLSAWCNGHIAVEKINQEK